MPSPNLSEHSSPVGVPVKVLALCVGQRSVFSSPPPAAVPGLFAAAQGGLDSPREDVGEVGGGGVLPRWMGAGSASTSAGR